MLARAPPLVEKLRVALREMGEKEVVIFLEIALRRYVLKYETGNAGSHLEGGRLLPSIYLSIDWPLSEMRGRLPWGVE